MALSSIRFFPVKPADSVSECIDLMGVVLKEIRLLHHCSPSELAAPGKVIFKFITRIGMNPLSLFILSSFLVLVCGSSYDPRPITWKVDSDSDLTQVDYASMEIRTAINYQTEAIGTVLKNLTQVSHTATCPGICMSQKR